MADLAFILVKSKQPLDPKRIVAAAEELGLELTAAADGTATFDLAGGGKMVAALIDVQHPDAMKMPVAPTSPTRAEVEQHTAHVIVSAHGLDGNERERDTMVAALTAAVLGTTDAIGAMLGHGVVFHKAALFQDMAALGLEEGAIPTVIAVDITGAQEGAERMSFLSHGMKRYGREEIYVTCPTKGKGALGFVMNLIHAMVNDTAQPYPTGDTIGRDADERLVIQRVPSPAGLAEQVIRLDLPD